MTSQRHTFWAQLGVPKWKVRVVSVVPSLQKILFNLTCIFRIINESRKLFVILHYGLNLKLYHYPNLSFCDCFIIVIIQLKDLLHRDLVSVSLTSIVCTAGQCSSQLQKTRENNQGVTELRYAKLSKVSKTQRACAELGKKQDMNMFLCLIFFFI